MKPRFDYRALGRLKSGAMNKTETAYAHHLESLKQAGEVLWYKFEGIKLRLADKTFYSPDFAVMNKNFEIEIHEVKGFMADDANVKIKVAAEMYPMRFKLIRLKKGGWETSEVGNVNDSPEKSA
jgi:hypothetical protein